LNLAWIVEVLVRFGAALNVPAVVARSAVAHRELCCELAEPVDRSDEENDRLGDRENELARFLTATPAPVAWIVFRKIEILEDALSEEGTNWTDNREVVMLAGIKADLLRFNINDVD
jgi:hypothetical protein